MTVGSHRRTFEKHTIFLPVASSVQSAVAQHVKRFRSTWRYNYNYQSYITTFTHTHNARAHQQGHLRPSPLSQVGVNPLFHSFCPSYSPNAYNSPHPRPLDSLFPLSDPFSQQGIQRNAVSTSNVLKVIVTLPQMYRKPQTNTDYENVLSCYFYYYLASGYTSAC